MSRKSVKPAFIIGLSIIVVLGALTFSNSNYYVMALKKYHKTIADSQPYTSYSNNEFYKIIDGQRNRCHNDYGLNAVVCEKDTETRPPIGQPIAPKNISNSSVHIPIVNQSAATTNSSTTTTTTTASTHNESSLQAVGPTFAPSNDSPNADTSAIFSTVMTPTSLDTFLKSKISSEGPQPSATP